MKFKILSFYDLTFILMLISALAFQDKKIFFLGFQLLFFIMTIVFTEKNDIPLKANIFWVFLFIFWSLLSSIWALDTMTAFGNVLSIVQTFSLNICIFIYLKNGKKIKIFYSTFILASLTLLMRIILTTSLSDWGTERIGGSLGYNQNNVGMIFAFSAILLFSRALLKKNKRDFVLFLAFTILSFFTGSRKAFLLTVLAPTLLINLKGRSKKLIRNIMFSVILFLILFNLVMNIELLYEVIGIRIERGLEMFFGSSSTVDKSAITRLDLIDRALTVFKNKPMSGIGIDNFKLVNNYNTYAHNNYFELMASLGIIGLFLYYWYPIYILIKSLKKLLMQNKEYAIISTLIISILIIDFWNVSYWMELIQIMLGFTFGYYQLLNKQQFLES